MCVCCLFAVVFCFFFFKQKTAYEMRISDWSSDVCSSDLGAHSGGGAGACPQSSPWPPAPRRWRDRRWRAFLHPRRCNALRNGAGAYSLPLRRRPCRSRNGGGGARWEEHTSELQSLMRNSYAVFGLKNKTQINSNP